ncbi:TRAP transporter large permease [Chloroflexota bacterium]
MLDLAEMHWLTSFSLIVIVLMTLFIVGVPIGFAMGLTGVLALLFSGGRGMEHVVNNIPTVFYGKTINYLFVIFPLFILMTEFMAYGGLSKKLVSIAYIVMGRIPGSLAVVTVTAATLFGAICGSAGIAAMAISDMLVPECMERKYDKALISGAIAASSNLSTIIPPSFVFILWGIIAEISIEELFFAGIIPGLIIASMFIIYIMIRAKRNPALAPLPPQTTVKEKLKAASTGWDVALIILIILGGVYLKIATITDIAAVAALVTLIIVLARRSLPLSGFLGALRRTAAMTSFFIILLMGAYFLIHALGVLQIPREISEWIISHDFTALQLIIVIQIMFFILGMFIDPGSVILVSLPVFLKSLNALDVDLYWFGVVIAISCMIANLTPPVGVNLFIVQGVGRPYGITFEHVVRGTIPFILLMIVGMALVLAFPELATWLPGLIKD